MVDERALDAACREFKEHLYIPGKTSDDERTAIKAAIEAYEAAKPSPDPWRPLATIKDCRPGRILVWVPIDDDHYERLFIDSVSDSEGDQLQWDEYASRPENSGAMFRTIDPPKQTQDKETPHALTE